MIDHITLGVADFDRATAFYDTTLAPLGVRRLFDVPPEQSEGIRVTGYGDDRAWFWLAEERPANGLIHFVFQASDHAQVDAFYGAAIAAGAKDNGRPGLRPQYHPNYYAAYVLDPDGHNIEAVCHAAL
ncbi:MAG: VOC family protein [Rhodobacteraceae bacterium]|nr:VOC family protein [Paracoccaceae bacterium]